MILITGGFGKLGKSLTNEIKNKKFILIKRGNKYKKINDNIICLNLNDKRHLKRLFINYNFTSLIHFAVTRNPLRIKTIRDTNTLIKDTLISINLILEMKNVKKIVLASSASIFQLKSLPDKVDRKLIVNNIIKFFDDKNNHKKVIIKNYFEKKRTKLKINPLFHKNDNMRLNGSNKLINEIFFVNYAIEKKIQIMIIRPSTIIETLKEKKDLLNKFSKLKKD